jgi:hypothetical protein
VEAALQEGGATLEHVANLKDLKISLIGEGLPSPASPLREDITAAVTAVVHARYPGIPVIPYMAPYATDGRCGSSIAKPIR